MEKIIVLYSYENESYKIHIERYLKALKSFGIKYWNDRETENIPDFKDAEVVVLMLSSYFIASDLIQDTVIPKVLEQSQLQLFPILLESCPIKSVQWLKDVEVFPKDGLALFEKTDAQIGKDIVTFVDAISSSLIKEKSGHEMQKEADKLKQIITNSHQFEDFRKSNCIYVDKTQHVLSLLEEGRNICFLSRPRRFGKSLLLNMMKALFLGKKELFKGLYIYDKYDFKPYPVIHLSFTMLPPLDRSLAFDIALYVALEQYFSDIANEQNIPIPKGPDLGNIITNLYKKTNTPVVLLIDEYDKTLLRYIKEQDKREIVRTVLKDIFSPLKDLTHILKFFFITGVSKFSKVSIFSDLNNLDDLTMLDDYSTIAGFTQQDVEYYFKDHIVKLAEKEGKTRDEILDQIRKWYDGYSWDGKNFVYAPFSISNVFKNLKFANYWFETGTPSFLPDVIKGLKEGELGFQNFESYQMVNTDIEKYDISNIKLLPFLFQSGYLSVYEKSETSITVRIPNMEVRISFYNYLFEELSPGNTDQLNCLKQAIVTHNIDEMMKSIKIIMATIPYQVLEKKENVYHSHFHTILKTVNQNTMSEVLTNIGRIDTLMETHDAIFIFEFKMASAKEGIRQIKRKGYAEGQLNKNKKIFLIGVKFSETSRNIEHWLYELAIEKDLINWQDSIQKHTEKILLLYSKQDEQFKEQIFAHVRMLTNHGILLIDDITFDEPDTLSAISSAKIVILLISHNILGSNIFQSKAITELAEKHKKGTVTVFPIIIKSCAYKSIAWIENIKTNDKPFSKLSEIEQDELMAELVEQMSEILTKKQQQ